ncbi:YggT family protein [Candidatus Albibeggiatoa sp. nov. NOAA]|uniref:YggT family protein n=1 Tax=Candidatus Albibeggiatoa sp. nov. NOAA TaxID=3162724 RepID=UPI0032FA5D99|nr:YggT family protein [Thiotrichaceae bacterium]
MSISPIASVFIFLISVLFGFYILLLMLRFLIRWMGINFRGEPMLQFLVQATNPVLLPLYNFIPGWRGVDFAALFVMMILKSTELLIIAALIGQSIGITQLLILAFAKLISLCISVFFWTILIQVILSWLIVLAQASIPYNVQYFLTRFNAPILEPLQRYIPPINGTVDISPLIALLLLQVIDILVIGYLT